MAKRLNVNLAFTADTSKAKAQLQDLQSQLSNLMNTAPLSDKLSVSEAAKTAAGQIAQLKAQLDNATNSAGKLDLTKFNESLKRSGMTITDYRKALTSLGPEGSKAFSNLATSIMNAEVPLKRTNALLDEFVVTLKNSARWQISSNILHGLESTLSSAVGYAESLNKSLTDIRIVTGYSSDQMAEFAEQANKAAKALNTTTTRYSDAALIYYQQGLSEQEVLERTDITVKMANVTGEAAQTISDQMTAVWNNFYDGSKSLEYYSDVLTRLGADTASSTDEITEGLEKFASVTGTIGLSYEYAAASLATITATTRESASVVGTALKTLFSRIQGLKLGETLEDGTDLNKYSEALAKVGIDIKDQNGELRDMDDILDEMGAKWGTLSRDQQTALAQTVAGVRQYTQLMTLMNHWDFFQENLESAYNATGALDEQADIFAESWEAASNRVRAAAEGIYQDIIDDDFVIFVMGLIEDTLVGIDNLINGLGGVEGAFASIGVIATKVLNKQITQELNNLGYNIKNIFSNSTKNEIEELRKQVTKELTKTDASKIDTAEGKAEYSGLKRKAELQDYLYVNANKLSDIEKQSLANLLDQNEAMTEQTVILGRQIDLLKQRSKQDSNNYNRLVNNSNLTDNQKKQAIQTRRRYEKSYVAKSAVDLLGQELTAAFDSQFSFNEEEILQKAQNINNIIKTISQNTSKAFLQKLPNNWFFDLEQDIQEIIGSNGKIKDIEKIRKLISKQFDSQTASFEFDARVGNIEQQYKNYLAKIYNVNSKEIENKQNKGEKLNKGEKQYLQDLIKTRDLLDEIANEESSFEEKIAKLSELFQDLPQQNDELYGTSEIITKIGNATLSLTSILQSAQGLFNIWNDEDISTGEKIITTLSTFGMVLPAIVSLYGDLADKKLINSLASEANSAANWLEAHSLWGIASAAPPAAAGEQLVGDSAGVASLGVGALTASLGKLLLAFVKIAAPIVAVGAAVAGFYYIINKDSIDANNNLIQTNKIINNLEESYDSLNQTVSKFKENISNYDNAVKAIKDLEQGTKEYYDAIESANSKAKELIETYELFDDYSIGTDGLINIDKDALEKVLAGAENSLNNLEIVNYSNKINRENNQIDGEIAQFVKKFNQKNASNYGEQISVEATKQSLEELSEASKSTGFVLEDYLKQKSEEVGGNFKLLYDSLADSNLGLANLIEAMNNASSATNYFASEILNSILGDRYDEVLRKAATNENGEFNLEKYNTLKTALANDPALIEAIKINQNNNQKEAENYSKYINSYEWLLTENGAKFKDYLSSIGMEDFKFGAIGWGPLAGNQTKVGYATIIASMLSQMDPSELVAKNNSIQDLSGNTVLNYGDMSFNDLKELLIQTFTDLNSVSDIISQYSTSLDEKLQFNTSIYNAAPGEEYGVDFSSAIVNQITSKSDTMDLSSYFNELDPTEISEIQSMTPNQLLNWFGINEGLEKEAANQLIYAFKNALNEYSEKNYYQNLKKSFEAEIEALDVDFNIDELEAYAEHLEDLEPLLEEDRELALDIAMAHMRLAESTETLAKNWDDWNKVMTSGDSLAIAKLSDDLAVVMQNMLNLTPEQFSLLPDDFVEDHWDMIQDVYNGVEGAVEGLQELAGEEILLGEIKASFNGQEISNEVKGLFAELEGMTPPQITVGTNIDQLDAEAQRYVELLNMIVQACGWTAEEASAKLLALGFNATFRETTKKIKVPRVIKTSDGSDGSEQFETIEQEISVPAIEIETLYSRFGGNIGSSSSIASSGKTAGTSGGKDDTPEKMDTTDREDMVERYKEINDSLDDVADALSDVNKLTDRLYGKNRISALKNQNALLQQEIGLLKEKASQAKAYLAQDQSRLQSAAADLGASFSFDAQGNISNYTAQMNALYDQLAAAENKFNSLGSKTAQEEYQKSTLDPLNDKISELQDAISQYDETRELLEDIENEIDDAFYQWQDNNYEILTYELEIKIELNDLELKEIEYYLNKISDDFYQMAEAASLMMDKSPVIQEDLAAYGDYYEQLTSAYNAGDISQADYVEGLKDSYDAIIDNLEALLELDKEMMEYYGKTVKAAQEELDKYTNRLEHLTGVLDHYKNLMDILGRNKDYASLGIILEGQAKTLKDELDVATKDYQMWVEQEAYWANQMEQTLSDPMAYELAKKNWEEAYDAMADAQDKMLTKTEEWTKALRAVLENQLAGYAQSLEDALTGGTNFDQMNDALERAQSLQEEFLTDTNKIYETEKLMRKARDDINKTNNEKAKQRLQGFIDETEELQNQAELSEFELKVQQAKYDLLLAEIALEEAQNAKSTVRLQRDSEGNFGYVYTADQAAVSDAEQQFADAQNSLYNIGLQGTYEYTEKYQQMVQEMYESLTQLQQDYLNGEFATEEEYQDAILATKEYYYEKLKDYSYLYSEALQTDSRVVADSWAVDFEDMTLNTEMWMEHVDVYIDQVGNAFEIWAERSEAANEVVGDSLDETKEKVEEVTDASSDLKDEIVGEVIPAIEDELDSVNAATSAWAAQRAELYSVISTYEQLISTIRAAIAAQAALDNYQAKSVNVGSGGGGGAGNIGNNNYYSDDKNPVNPETGGLPTSYTYEAIVERDNGHGAFGTQRVSGTIAIYPGEDLEKKIAERHKADYATVIKKFDTGGYTGNWGPEGKLAFLHQKELVLNAVDTENFLSAIGIIREISHAIDLQSLASQFSGLSSVGYNSNTSNVLEQNVHIEASFPNVSEHLEIEMALNNLVNTASQYANRK